MNENSMGNMGPVQHQVQPDGTLLLIRPTVLQISGELTIPHHMAISLGKEDMPRLIEILKQAFGVDVPLTRYVDAPAENNRTFTVTA